MRQKYLTAHAPKILKILKYLIFYICADSISNYLLIKAGDSAMKPQAIYNKIEINKREALRWVGGAVGGAGW